MFGHLACTLLINQGLHIFDKSLQCLIDWWDSGQRCIKNNIELDARLEIKTDSRCHVNISVKNIHQYLHTVMVLAYIRTVHKMLFIYYLYWIFTPPFV